MMKKVITVLLVCLLSCSLLFSESSLSDSDKEELIALLDEYMNGGEKLSYVVHLSVDSAMVYGFPTLGGILDIGVAFDTVTISGYLRYEHFFKPLGSDTGKLALGEEFGEAGLSMKIKIYEKDRFSVNVGINTAWYQQWLMLRSNAGTYNLTNNGLLIRPEASIGWRLFGPWTVQLGLYYQTPLYPSYSGYQGWGCFARIF